MIFIKVTIIDSIVVEKALINMKTVKSLVAHFNNPPGRETSKCIGTTITFLNSKRLYVEESIEKICSLTRNANLAHIGFDDIPKIGDEKIYKHDED